MKMKYVITSGTFPILFNECLVHGDVCSNFAVKSAGFCSVDFVKQKDGKIITKVYCWGESETLKRKSNPEDASLIEQMLNNNSY